MKLRIRDARERKKITQKMLSIKLGVAQTTVSGWENDNKKPSIDAIRNIAIYLGVSTDYLLGLTENPLTVTANNKEYIEVSPFEKLVFETYKKLSTDAKIMVCGSMGIEHPAFERARANRA